MRITLRKILGINEQAFDLDRIEDKIYDDVGNIVTNWCLVRKAEEDVAYSWNHHHWLNELRDALDRCFRAKKNAKYSKKAIDRRIDDAFLVDSRSNQVSDVYDLYYGKLVEDECIPEQEALALAEAWCSEGLAEVLALLKDGTSSREYISAKRAKAPHRG